MPGAGQADYQASVFYKWTQRLEEEKTIVGEEESVSNDESFIFVPKAGKFGWPACVCMESVALGIMAKSQPQTVLSRRGSAMH